ncbi:uracil-DNA glycosylase family protein [Chromobacterium haemolyticum]|uniref:uracil-DNA glycosylase family protein n=1 Tax=Chromobacterium haemolyticum TaxID=394935 RepID=UPI00405554BE
MLWDPGPPPPFSSLFESAPLASYQALPAKFRLEWGPVYYRGRLDGSAKVLIVGQDPSADENLARRAMVGTAGQRVQGFLRKLGLDRSYVIVNASLYSIYGQFDAEMAGFMDQAAVRAWRNQLLDQLKHPGLQAVIGFGKAAAKVLDDWPGAASFKAVQRLFQPQHPTARAPNALLKSWNQTLAALAPLLNPDPGVAPDPSPYELTGFRDKDLARIPALDLPFGMPAWLGRGDMATRVIKGQAKLKAPAANASILWTAQADQG